MTTSEILAALDDPKTLALTAWAEARAIPRNDPDSHSPVEELIAVMVVVRNRKAHFGRWRATDPSFKAVCLAPMQFSCWNDGTDANHVALMAQAAQLAQFPNVPVTDPLIRECLYLAAGVIADVLVDRTGGADSYYAPAAMKPVGRMPTGAVGKVKTLIGDQLFYVAS